MQHPGNGPGGEPRIAFLSHRLGTDHAEGISLLDMNGDGFPDLLSGAYWYENPGANGGEWKQHQFRTVGIHNEFVSDCGEWIVDVDHDGLPDLVTTGWISNGVWVYRNPGPEATTAGTMWKAEKITDSYDTEGGAFVDINGDGKPDLALAHYNRSGVIWIDFSKDKPRVHHLGGHEQDGHGIGVADINGDGKADVLTTHGWFEQIDADNDQWKWHGDWDLGDTGFPILGYDVNHDGKMDLIYGQGHGYGLYWLEQAGTPTSLSGSATPSTNPSRSRTPCCSPISTMTASLSSSPANAIAATPATTPAPTTPSSSMRTSCRGRLSSLPQNPHPLKPLPAPSQPCASLTPRLTPSSPATRCPSTEQPARAPSSSPPTWTKTETST